MKIIKHTVALLLLLFCTTAFAQVQIDHSISLTGSGTNATITGIKSVTNTQDATSVGSLQSGTFLYADAQGTGNAFTLNISPAITAYQKGMVFNFIANQNITGSATLNIDNIGAVTIKKNINQNLFPCDIQNNQAVTVLFDGTNFQVISLLVSVVPFVGIRAIPGTTICSGDNILFNTSITNGGTSPVYQWQVNGSNVGSGATTYSSSSLNNGDVVTCILTSNATCASPSTVTSPPVTITVNNAPVSVSIAANPSGVVPANTNVTFTATPVNPGSNPVYQWQVNGNNVGSGGTTFSSSSLNNGDLVTCVLTSDASCATQNPATSNTVTMAVGLHIADHYAGGIIYYLDGTGVHGLVCSDTDLVTGNGALWYNGTYFTTGATGNALYAGQTNTATIISAQGSGTYAASICSNYNGGGYTDWYLPSIYELVLLAGQYSTIGNLQPAYYWSSTEADANNAYASAQHIGNQIATDKNSGSVATGTIRLVRAVRAF